MKPSSDYKEAKKPPLEMALYIEIMEKRKMIKDLLLRNLMKTNLKLLKNLDISNSVLF